MVVEKVFGYRLIKMKNLIRLEEIALFLLALYLNDLLYYSWWVFWAFLLVPDLSMLGYVVNTKVGAFIYNIIHHRGLAILLGLAGTFFFITELQFAGIVLFGHIAMDRALGYGLKYEDHFQHTHLGWIGKSHDK